MAKHKKNSSKVSVDVTPARMIAGLGFLLVLCVAGFFAMRAAQNAQQPASQPVSGTLAPLATPLGQQPAAQNQPVIPGADTFDTLDAWQFKASSGAGYKFSLQNGEFLEEASGTALHNYYTGGEFSAATVQVDARWVGGSEDKNSRYGMVVRRSEKNAYYFEYLPFQDAQWIFQVGLNDKFDVLAKGNLPKDRLRPPATFSRFKIEMTATRAKLYINDALLAEVDVSAVPKGSVGLITTADAGKKAVAAFDNFAVK